MACLVQTGCRLRWSAGRTQAVFNFNNATAKAQWSNLPRGLLVVRSSGLVDHLGTMGRRTQRLLPLGSAIVVTILGIVISAKGVLADL